MLYQRKNYRMKNTPLILFLIVTFYSNGQINYDRTTVYADSLNNNKGNWTINDDWRSKATISNGLLTHYFCESGYSTVNLTKIQADTITADKLLTFRVANLNNKSETSYYQYKKLDNGNIKKENKTISNPSWGITWGFKDWSNYHALRIQSREEYGIKSTYYKVVSLVNGSEIIHKDWTKHYSLAQETGFSDIYVKFSSGYCSIYFGLYTEFSSPDAIYKSTEWYDNSAGIIISSPAKVALDLLKVERMTLKPLKVNYNVPYNQITTMVEEMSKNLESQSMWIDTKPNGTRYFYIEKLDVEDILPNDEIAFCKDLSKRTLDIMFQYMNYNREKAIPYNDLIEVYKEKGVLGFEVKTAKNLHKFSWEELK